MKIRKIVKTSALLTVLLICGLSLFAQNRNGQGRGTQEQREQIEIHKIAYLTDKLDLTSSEAEKFWPIYNDNRDKMNEERKEFKSTFSKNQDTEGELSEEEASVIIKSLVEHEQRMLDIRKSYFNDLNKALTPQKIVKLIKAEKGFREEMVRRVSKGQGKGQGKGSGPGPYQGSRNGQQ